MVVAYPSDYYLSETSEVDNTKKIRICSIENGVVVVVVEKSETLLTITMYNHVSGSQMFSFQYVITP